MRRALTLLVVVTAVLSGCGTGAGKPGPDAADPDQPFMKPCRAETPSGTASMSTPAPSPEPSVSGKGWRTIHRFCSDRGRRMWAQGIAAFGPRDVWAAAMDGQPGDTHLHHWDGASWRNVPLPNRSAGLQSISGTSGKDLWLLTLEGAQHWDGRRWTSFDFGDHFMGSEIAVRTRNDVWAVGNRYEAGKQSPYAQHWNGDAWRKMTTPKDQEEIAIVSANDVWAVNSTFQTVTDGYTFMHWDGHRWESVDAPPIKPPPGGDIDRADGLIGDGEIYDLTVGPSGDLWAVGIVGWAKPDELEDEDAPERFKGLSLHWDGQRWSYTLGAEGARYKLVAPDGAGGIWITTESSYLHRDRNGKITTVNAPGNVPGRRDGRGRVILNELVNVPGSTSMLAIANRTKPYGDTVVQAYGPLA